MRRLTPSRVHVVSAGESTSQIAARYRLSLSQLLRENPERPTVWARLPDGTRRVFASLAPGDVLRLPTCCR